MSFGKIFVVKIERFGYKMKVNFVKKVFFLFLQKGHDPNPWFSGITFFSGLALWSLQIKKRSLMGCLFFDADFSTFFHFGR